MIGSVFEQRDQLLALERRRQEIAAQHTAQQPPAGVPAAAPAGVMPAAAPAAVPAAFKAAEPDIAKRKKGRDRKGRGLAADEVATAALDEGRGYRDALDDEASRKSFRDRGVTEGPGDFAAPGKAEAEQFQRPYESAGHAAESPQAGLPRQTPIAHARQGIVQPIALPGALTASYVPAHVTASVSMGSPSERAR